MNFICRIVREFLDRDDKPKSDKADQVRALLGKGLTIREIANLVGLTESQVEDIFYWAVTKKDGE